MEVTKYDPPDADPCVLSAVRFDPWPFDENYVALHPGVVTRRVTADGRLSTITCGAWSLAPGNLLVQLSNGETVHAFTQEDLDLYLNRTGTP